HPNVRLSSLIKRTETDRIKSHDLVMFHAFEEAALPFLKAQDFEVSPFIITTPVLSGPTGF
ncbi:MAG: hypothetical protein AAFO75_07245, partial [Pseudomonadota bacterium]